MGEDNVVQCQYFVQNTAASASPKKSKSHVSEDDYLLPWTGNSLGSVDLQFVAGRSRPWMVGIIGSHSSGKTTLLTAFYLLLSQGQRLHNRVFANSYSLRGWENLANELRWNPNDGPTFPPHTSSNAKRKPGLMHMAFRRENEEMNGQIEDVILTDAPGEWFERWAINANDPAAEGARYVMKHADSFLLLADCEALSGPDRGIARNELFQLGQRLSDHLEGRPLAVVWSKADKEVPSAIKNALRERFTSYFPNYQEFDISIYSKHGEAESLKSPFVNILEWALPTDIATDTEEFFSLDTAPQTDEGKLSLLLKFRGR